MKIRVTGSLLAVLLLALSWGCSVLTPLGFGDPTEDFTLRTRVAQTLYPEFTRQAAAWTPTATITPTPTLTPPVPTDPPCGFEWASQPLPDVSARLQAGINAAGYQGVEGRAAAYGENCLAQDGKVVRFAAMQTDFYLTIPASDLNNRAAMGNQVEEMLKLLLALPSGTFPGTQKGQVGISFRQGEQQYNLWFSLAQGELALKNGLRGEELLRELRRD